MGGAPALVKRGKLQLLITVVSVVLPCHIFRCENFWMSQILLSNSFCCWIQFDSFLIDTSDCDCFGISVSLSILLYSCSASCKSVL